MSDTHPTRLTDAEEDAILDARLDDESRREGFTVLGPGGTDGNTPTLLETVRQIKADAYAAGLAARGGNTDDGLRAVYLTLAQVEDLRRWLSKAVDGGVSLRQEAANEGRHIIAALDAAPALTSVTSVEPGCTCGGIAACQQCQERDAASAPTDNQHNNELAVRIRALADEIRDGEPTAETLNGKSKAWLAGERHARHVAAFRVRAVVDGPTTSTQET